MTPRRRIIPLFIPHLGCPNDCVFCNQKRISGSRFPVSAHTVSERLSELPAGGSKPVGVAASPATCDIMLQQNDLLLISTNGLFKAFRELRGVALPDYLAAAAPKSVEDCHRLLTSEIEPFIRKRYSDDITFIIAGKP